MYLELLLALAVSKCRDKAKDLLPQSLRILPIPRRLECLVQRKACIPRYRELVQRRIRKSLQSNPTIINIIAYH